MANLNLPTVELVSTLRAAPQNGSPSSQDYNDSWTESLADLASLSGFLNEVLIPMLDGLSAAIMPNPQGTANGLEGRYVFSDSSDLTTLFFDSLSGQPLSIADSLRVLQGITQSFQASINTLNVEVTALQTQLSSTNQNDIAQALQNFAASLQSLTSQTVSNTQAISNAALQIQTEGTDNAVQNKLNVVAGPGIAVANTPTTGDVVIASDISLATGGVPNSTQVALNLQPGANIGMVEAGGTVTVAYIGPVPVGGLTLKHNGAPNGSQSLLDLQEGTGITISDNGIGTLTITGSPAVGGTAIKTGDYPIVAGDSGQLLQMNSAAAHIFTLPNPPPNSKWFVILKNINTGVVTVSRNTLTIDGKSSNPSLGQGDATMIFTDGANYFTGGSRIFDLAIFAPSTGVNSQILSRVQMTRACIFPAGAPNAYATASFAATASTTFTLKKGITAFATVNFGILSTTGVFTQASDVVFAPGDVFEVDGPGFADSTLSDVGITLQGYRF